MSRSQFSLLAAGITVAGLTIVVLAARSVHRLLPSPKRILAGSFLLIYGVILVLRPSAWPFIDLAVLTGAVGGVLLLEGGLQTKATVVVFLSVAAIVDVESMSGGLSHLLVERYRTGTSDFLLYLTLVAPIRDRAIPIVGIGDLLVGGAAATALLRLGLRPVPVMGTFAIGLLSALAYGLWRGGAPALPFVTVFVLILVWQNRIRAGRQPRPEAASSGD
jgi:hypothetical protein